MRFWIGVAAALALPAVLGGAERQAPVQISAFEGNGCTGVPDGSWYNCCYLHDLAYWAGGTKDERKQADRDLRACVLEMSGSRFTAWLMYRGARLLGGPGWPTAYRWGHGWPRGSRPGYAPLTPDERAQVEVQTRAACAALAIDAGSGTASLGDEHRLRAIDVARACPRPMPGRN